MELKAKLAASSPDNTKFEIRDAREVGPHLVMLVQYPNCTKCSYEGKKVMVFLNTKPLDALKWKKIDPHFSDPKEKRPVQSAPSPAARFPASTEGWQDAMDYARSKIEKGE